MTDRLPGARYRLKRYTAWHHSHGALDGNYTVSGPDGVYRPHNMSRKAALALAERLNREAGIDPTDTPLAEPKTR